MIQFGTKALAAMHCHCVSASLPICATACVYRCLCVSLAICITACLYHCLSVSLPICITACRYRCMFASLPVCTTACLCRCPFVSLAVCITACLCPCLHVSQLVCVTACVSLPICATTYLCHYLSVPLPVCVAAYLHHCMSASLAVCVTACMCGCSYRGRFIVLILWNLPPHVRTKNCFLLPWGILPQGDKGTSLPLYYKVHLSHPATQPHSHSATQPLNALQVLSSFFQTLYGRGIQVRCYLRCCVRHPCAAFGVVLGAASRCMMLTWRFGVGFVGSTCSPTGITLRVVI